MEDETLIAVLQRQTYGEFCPVEFLPAEGFDCVESEIDLSGTWAPDDRDWSWNFEKGEWELQ